MAGVEAGGSSWRLGKLTTCCYAGTRKSVTALVARDRRLLPDLAATGAAGAATTWQLALR